MRLLHGEIMLQIIRICTHYEHISTQLFCRHCKEKHACNHHLCQLHSCYSCTSTVEQFDIWVTTCATVRVSVSNKCSDFMYIPGSFIFQPSPFIFVYCKQSKTGPWESLKRGYIGDMLYNEYIDMYILLPPIYTQQCMYYLRQLFFTHCNDQCICNHQLCQLHSCYSPAPVLQNSLT